MLQINTFIDQYFSNLHMPSIRWTDAAEILIIAFLVYHILLWIKNTRAWALLRGIVVIAAFILIAVFFEMNTILWIVSNLIPPQLCKVKEAVLGGVRGVAEGEQRRKSSRSIGKREAEDNWRVGSQIYKAELSTNCYAAD